MAEASESPRGTIPDPVYIKARRERHTASGECLEIPHELATHSRKGSWSFEPVLAAFREGTLDFGLLPSR